MSQFGAELTITDVEGSYRLSGDVDAHTAPRLDETVQAHLAANSSVRLDTSDVSFMDSSGIRVLISGTTKARESGGDLVVVNPSSMVRRLIEVSGLSAHLTVEPEQA